MEIISAIFGSIATVFRFHKKKVLFLLLAITFCFLILFPYDDLSDMVTHQVSVNTNNNVYIQFDNLSFGFLPQLGIKMQNVLVESVFAPAVSLETLGIAPKISSLIFGSPGGKLKAGGLFGGDADISFGRGSQLEIDGQQFEIDVEADDIDLTKLSKFAKASYKLPLEAKGKGDIEALVHVDPLFKAQPMGKVKLLLKNVVIPPISLPVGGVMTFPLPGLKMKQLVLNGVLSDGKVLIKEGKLGTNKDDLFGSITGDFVMNVRSGGRVQLGGYDLKLDLNFSENLRKQLGLILTIVDDYKEIGSKFKSESLKGVRYNMTVSSHSLTAPPRISSP